MSEADMSKVDVGNAVVEVLRKQKPDEIREWLHNPKESMIPVVAKHYKLIRMVLRTNKKAREMLKSLDYEQVKKNVCEIYPELEQDFEDEKVKVKVEAEIKTIKSMLGV
jgi:predicted transcriptional regulator